MTRLPRLAPCVMGAFLATVAASAVRADDTRPADVACDASGADYALLPDPRYRIVLEPADAPNTASDLQLRLRTPRGEHVFAFALSNGYATIHLLEVVDEDPGDDQDDPDAPPPPAFHAFDAAMNARIDPPQSDTPAPAWLFVPELGPMLWYGLLHGAAGAAPEPESMPAGLFRRVACTP